MKNTPEEAKYAAIKYILEHPGFHQPEIQKNKLIFKDAIQSKVLEEKGITPEHIDRYIKEKNEKDN
jgi:hypothetical protein